MELAELVLEVTLRTGFTEAFTHLTDRSARTTGARVESTLDFSLSLCAALLAEACNTGPEPFIRHDMPALRRDRIAWVKQNYLRDESTLTQLNRTEGRHSVARVVFSGKRGELRQRYREGQEDQLGALGLVVNMIVLWNTIYTEAVLEQLRKEGYPISEDGKARFSPLIDSHINMQGRHSFMMPEAVVKGELRPLRNPHDDPD